MKESDLVMIRVATKYGFSNTWWRVMFIDNDGTFIGKLERCHWHEYEPHRVGDTERLKCEDVSDIYKEGQQFCYSDKITICNCPGLCRNN